MQEGVRDRFDLLSEVECNSWLFYFSIKSFCFIRSITALHTEWVHAYYKLNPLEGMSVKPEVEHPVASKNKQRYILTQHFAIFLHTRIGYFLSGLFTNRNVKRVTETWKSVDTMQDKTFSLTYFQNKGRRKGRQRVLFASTSFHVLVTRFTFWFRNSSYYLYQEV